MVVTEVGMDMVIREDQEAKAPEPRDITEVGMEMKISEVQK